MFTFPVISTENTVHQQIRKLSEELVEYIQSSGVNSDLEVLDVLQACETLVRIHFRGRDKLLQQTIRTVIEKNKKRGYYK